MLEPFFSQPTHDPDDTCVYDLKGEDWEQEFMDEVLKTFKLSKGQVWTYI
jgi:hypothetical protein